jgi:serine/threonine-protein kinase
MSPEQVTAQKHIDNRSDLWALGVVAFEALTGQRPYDGPSFGALAVKIATGSPPKPTEVNPALPPMVDLWFAKACARDPRERFSSAKEMAEAFRAAFEGVISLPPGVISSDSGQRNMSSSSGSRSPSGSGSGSGSGEGKVNANTGPGPSGPAPSPTFGLAATALDDSDAGRKHAALGRSEAGVSVVEDGRSRGQRGSPLLFIGGAVALTIAVGAVIVLSARTPPAGPGTAAIGTTAPSTALTASVPPVVSGAASSPIVTVVVDAASPATSPTMTITTTNTAHPPPGKTTTRGNASSGGTARPPVPDTAPKPTAKPTSSEPDLF